MWEKLKARLKAQGLTEEQIQAIADGMKEDSIHLSAEENIDVRYSKLKEDKAAVDEQLKTANGTIKNLEKNNADNEALQTEITGYKDTIKKLQDEAVSNTKLYNLKEALRAEKVIDADYLIFKQGGVDKFNFDGDNKPIGIKEALQPYRDNQSMAHLFAQEETIDIKGATKVPGQVTNPTVKDTSKMTYSELCAYMSANPDAQF